MGKVSRPGVVARQRLSDLDPPEHVTLSLAELAHAAEEHLLSVALGLATLRELMEAELSRVVGPKGKHRSDRTSYRHGLERRSVTLGGDRTINGPWSPAPDPPGRSSSAPGCGHSVIDGSVRAGAETLIGHGVLARERTCSGMTRSSGARGSSRGTWTIRSRVSVQSPVFIRSHTCIGSDVCVGPGAVLTNDPYPLGRRTPLPGPRIRDGASSGAGASLLHGVTGRTRLIRRRRRGRDT